MKKVIICCSFLVTVLMSIILIISITRKDEKDMKVFTIPREYSYWYQQDRDMTFNIYMNIEEEYLLLPDENQYELKTENASIRLNQVTVEKKVNCKFSGMDIYRYQISSPLIENKTEDIHLKDVFLRIVNNLFHLEVYLGDIHIYKNDYKELKWSDLYGQYALVDQELTMIGLIICLQEDATYLNEVSIGCAYGHLEYIEKDVLKDSEISSSLISHPVIQPHTVLPPYLLNAKMHYYFIPISYENKKLITNAAIRFKIDGEYYMIDNFSYYATTIQLKDYQKSMREGKIVYVET